MKTNTPELMWARQHWGGEVWEDSLSKTQPMARQFPPEDGEDEEQTDEQRDEQWGEVKLFRVTIEEVPKEEQDAHLAEQKAFFARIRSPRA